MQLTHLSILPCGIQHQDTTGLQAGQAVVLGQVGLRRNKNGQQICSILIQVFIQMFDVTSTSCATHLQVHAQVVGLVDQVAAGQGLGAEAQVRDRDASRLMRIV